AATAPTPTPSASCRTRARRMETTPEATMQTVHTDVLIIGTGFGAAAPALRLAEAGAKVVMVEKGPKVQTADFRQTSDPQYLLKYIQGTPGDHLSLTYAEALGGGSGFYEMVSLRAPSLVFDPLDGQ